ncbi:MAG: Rieske (2Fe-2S) protein [Pyrinomonadaceae bacterium]|nr:Rieske (2Fe-2S) protein [Pyrinomonadaceae bacterium]
MSSNNLNSAIDKVLSDESDVREATSPHQRDFPYERDGEAQVTRREFCNFLAVTSTALFVSSGGFAAKSLYDSQKTEVLPAMKIEEAVTLKPGSALNFRYPTENDSAILVRSGDGEYYAYGQKCTHLACPVYFEKDAQRLECPCHEAGFDVKTGNVLYGPPPRPLDKIAIEVKDNGEVWATGREVGGWERA